MRRHTWNDIPTTLSTYKEKRTRYTSEGYKIINGTAYDEKI